MRRRDFIELVVGSAIAWPLAARAQQTAMPVVGFLNGATADGYRPMVDAFRSGLQDFGFVDGQNVVIEYRWAEGHNERLPAMAGDLVHRQVAVIAATSTPAALAAKAATTTIPIVFETGGDPVELGLVTSLNRPGGNVTGTTQLGSQLAAKRLELLHDLLPSARVMALLVNPANPAATEPQSREAKTAADKLGIELHVLHASSERDLDAVFADVIRVHAGGLVVGGGDPFLTSQAHRLGELSLQRAVPAVAGHEFVAAGGLIGYSGSITDSYRLTGVYAGRILKGEKPEDLPVQQSAKIELFLNLKTAKTLGLTIPLTMLGRADEVIE